MLASSLATLDELTSGRAILGLGIGGQGLPELGIERKLPVAAMREAVEMIRPLLEGKEVSSQGKVVSLAGAKLAIKPVQDRIPIYFATHGAQIAKLAGQIADGVLIANTLNPAAFDFYVKQLDEGMAKAGRPAAAVDIGLRVEACIADDDEAAFAVMRKRVASRVLAQYPHWDIWRRSASRCRTPSLRSQERRPWQVAGRCRGGADAAGGGGVHGARRHPERCAQQLARGLGPRITHLTVRPHTVPGQDVAEVLAAFARDVVPSALQLRKQAAAS